MATYPSDLEIANAANKKPINEITIVIKKFKWFSDLFFFFSLGSSEKIVAIIPINIKNAIIT